MRCGLGAPKTADEAFHRAVELDTSFALAYYRLAGFNIYEVPKAQEMVDRALRHSDRLGEHHRGLLLAMAALLRGDHAAADQQYRLILAAHPDDAEAWLILGWLTTEKGHLLGRAWVDAREAFERVLALDPGNAEAVFWLAAIAAREGRRTDLDSLTDRSLRLDPAPCCGECCAANAQSSWGIRLGRRASWRTCGRDPTDAAQASGGLVTWTTGNLSAGRRLWRLITEPSRSLGMRLLAHVILAKIELTNGRWRAAQAELEAAETMDAGVALEHRAFYALTRFLSAPDSELIVLRDSLRRLGPYRRHRRRETGCSGHRGLHPYIRLYLLGLLSARLRDEPAARRYVAELERVDRSSPAWPLRGRQGPGPYAASSRGSAGGGRRRLRYWWGRGSGPTIPGWSRRVTHRSPPTSMSGSPAPSCSTSSAVRTRRSPGTGAWRTISFIPDRPSCDWPRSTSARATGRRAIEHYSRFVELWRDSDPELQPMVHQARQALARLR